MVGTYCYAGIPGSSLQWERHVFQIFAVSKMSDQALQNY